MTFIDIVYALCALTSLLCAVLLWRGYRANRQRLLLWSTLCFAGLFLNNALLIADVSLALPLDLDIWRTLPALAGISCLVYGLVWDSEVL